MAAKRERDVMDVPAAAAELEVSESTVWRLLRRGELESVVRGRRRLVLRRAVERRSRTRGSSSMRPLTPDHPLWRLVGAARSGGVGPGSEDKYAALFDE